MWIPSSVEEIEHAARAGGLEESFSFDGKLALPANPKKNVSLAIDIAAMATDGGVLLYGVGEDQNQRLTVLEPIALRGAADRVGQIVASSIAEVPHIELREYPCSTDPARGYLAVLVPQSPRAPHQVTVGGDLRFYGRGAKGNRILTEGDVARLYQRRQEWDQNRELLLAQVVEQAPFGAKDELAYLHGFSRPVAPSRNIWQRAISMAGGREKLLEQIAHAAQQTRPPHNSYSPNLTALSGWRRQGADKWLLSSAYRENTDAQLVASVTLDIDGSGRLFCGRAAVLENPHNVQPPRPRLLILESVIAGNLVSFLAMIGTLYRTSGYYGHVDIGLAVTGLRGGYSYELIKRPFWFEDERQGYNADTYRRHERVAAATLSDPQALASSLLGDLFETTTGNEDFDAFA